MYKGYQEFYIVAECRFPNDLEGFFQPLLNHEQHLFLFLLNERHHQLPESINICGELIEPPLNINSFSA